MTTPSFPTVWYWVVNDTNPTTQVWEGSSGAFIANSAANYLSWVANGGSSGQGTNLKQINVTGAADNGSGLIRLIVDSTSLMTTNDRWVVQNVGGTTEANGTWPLTVIDPTHVDLQGSAFVHAFASNGVIDRGTVIDTAANLYSVINSYNAVLVRSLYSSLSSAVDLALTNPLSNTTQVNITAANKNVKMPQMNLFGSIPIGVPIFIKAAGLSNSFSLYAEDGINFIRTMDPNDVIQFISTDNSSIIGQHSTYDIPAFLFSLKNGGALDAMIPIVQSDANSATWTSLGGDGTLSDTGALTVGSKGTWTPTDASGASLTFTAADGNYVKVGKMVMVQYRVVYPVTADGSSAVIGGLPFTEGTSNARAGGACSFSTLAGLALIVSGSSTHALPFVGAVQKTNAQMSTVEIRGSFVYEST